MNTAPWAGLRREMNPGGGTAVKTWVASLLFSSASLMVSLSSTQTRRVWGTRSVMAREATVTVTLSPESTVTPSVLPSRSVGARVPS